MIKFILFTLMLGLLVGCGQEQTAELNRGGGGRQGKTCALDMYETNISIDFDWYTALPNKLSVHINGAPFVDECTLSNKNEKYTLARSDKSAAIAIWVLRNATLKAEYFADNRPIEKRQFSYVVYGRDNCHETPSVLYQTTLLLNWDPVYSSGDKTCGIIGYLAAVEN